MKIDTIIWLALPIIVLSTGTAITLTRSRTTKTNKRCVAAGIVLTIIVIGFYIIFRSLFLGGF